MKEDRPGLKALEELGVRSPLAEAGISKAEVRRWARKRRLPGADRSPSPCLATRFPPGEPVREEALFLIYQAERRLREHFGIEPLRVRYLRGEARLEVPPSKLGRFFRQRTKILELLKGLGFRRISLDLKG